MDSFIRDFMGMGVGRYLMLGLVMVLSHQKYVEQGNSNGSEVCRHILCTW